MTKPLDITGETYGRLTALYVQGWTYNKGAIWRCRCACGAEVDVKLNALRTGNTKSCGCYMRELTQNLRRTHGMSKHPAYKSYKAAKTRCTNPRQRAWKHYGGRGIQFRLPEFDEFWEIMGASWFEGASIDRIDNNGHYEIGNVRWATDTQQGFNRRNNVWIEFNGERKSLTQWAAQLDMHHRVLSNRLKKWSVEDALTKPIKGRNHVRTQRSGSDEQG